MGGAHMPEDNDAIAGGRLDGFGAHFGEAKMDSGLVWFEGRKVVF
jgi:hypothetical protein